jgi:putative hydrolase of the HAD superfamily
MSRQLVPCRLIEYGIAHYFDPVVTSSCLGWRKPNERIFDEAARLVQLPPEACAYVGDTVSRDVIGARRAGYGLAIQIRSFLTEKSDLGVDPVPPDAVIQDLGQVVALLNPELEIARDH